MKVLFITGTIANYCGQLRTWIDQMKRLSKYANMKSKETDPFDAGLRNLALIIGVSIAIHIVSGKI